MTARLLTTVALVLLTCTGCTSSYTITFDMPPGNVARVEAKGVNPFLLVENRGPGEAEVTFLSDGEPTGPARRIAPGTATGRTVNNAKTVEVVSGPDEGTVVKVEALRAAGLRLDGPRPVPGHVFVEQGRLRAAETHWTTGDGFVTGSGTSNDLLALGSVTRGDFHVRARLRMDGQDNSAASFFLDDNHFGFEGAKGTLFVSGPLFGGLRLLQPSPEVFERGSWIDLDVVRTGDRISFMIDGTTVTYVEPAPQAFRLVGLRPFRSTMQVSDFRAEGAIVAREPGEIGLARGYTIPVVDLDADAARQVVVDREAGQYLGHPTTVLLEDGRTMLCVYPKGHGRGAIVYKRSDDAGLTWSDRLPVPENWATSREVPTIHRVIDPKTGAKRLIMWSGLYPARLAVSEDDGATWSPLRQVGDWGGIVVMGCLERLADGSYVALFHDDGRFFTENGARQAPVVFTLYQTFSHDGGLTWSPPEAIWSGTDLHLCEPGIFRSPDDDTLALLLRENSRRRNSYVMFSSDEAKTWSEPRELPAALTGDRHTGRYAPDGRLFISFRDTTHESPTKGDWVGWVGTWEDIVEGREGQYRVRLKDNKVRGDCAYPGVEVLSDGTYVVTTYGHWDEEREPYILSVRFTLAELDALRSGS